MVAPGGSVIQGCFPGGLSELQRRTFGTGQSPVVQRAVNPGASLRSAVSLHSSVSLLQPNTGWASGTVRTTPFAAVPVDLAQFDAPAGGQPLPAPLRQNMEAAFGASFANVRVHVGPQVARLGAIAITQGDNMYFAPGHYNPGTPQGRKLLGHELTHVVQQRAGRVRNPLGSGTVIVQNAALEAEAERMAQRAMFMPMHHASVRPERGATAVPVQAKSNRTVSLQVPKTAVRGFFNTVQMAAVAVDVAEEKSVTSTAYAWDVAAKAWKAGGKETGEMGKEHAEQKAYLTLFEQPKHGGGKKKDSGPPDGSWIGFVQNAWPCGECTEYFKTRSNKLGFVFNATANHGRYTADHGKFSNQSVPGRPVPLPANWKGYIYIYNRTVYYRQSDVPVPAKAPPPPP